MSSSLSSETTTPSQTTGQTAGASAGSELPPGLLDQFENALNTMETARPFAKAVHQNKLLSLTQKILKIPNGVRAFAPFAARFDAAGFFWGSDWENPAQLQPALARGALTGAGQLPALECASELRMLAIAQQRCSSDAVSAQQAHDFVEDVLARNLDLLFPAATEESREQDAPMAQAVQWVFEYLVEQIGTAGVLRAMVEEAERVLKQRPIITDRVLAIVKAAKRALPETPAEGEDAYLTQARRLINAAETPTELSRQHRDVEAYTAALQNLAPEALAQEASAFGESMNTTGLVAPTHAALLRHLSGNAASHLASALALNRIGRASLNEYPEVVSELITHAVWPDTAQCIYGLSRMLQRGIIFFQPVVPGLRRLMLLPIRPEVSEQLQTASGVAAPPSGSALLVAGTLSVLGQPRGVDQGHNPTCQAARAISLWSQNDVGYLLELIARGARDADIVMHFEGNAVRSSELSFGLAKTLHTELDPVSLVLTSHLDKVYMEMSRRTIGRGEDGHKWVNPELHGWWVHRSFAALVDAATGALHEFDSFMRTFYAAYHPEYNGGRDLVYAQPCGVAVTNQNGEFVGWHAVSIQRVQVDPAGVIRVYFFNPNRDKGQNWGRGAVTSTCNNGEQEGESSLPFELFASRLYVYHYKRREVGHPESVPADALARVRAEVEQTWGQGRNWLD